MGALTTQYLLDHMDHLHERERSAPHAVTAAALKLHNFTTDHHSATTATTADNNACLRGMVLLSADKETLSAPCSAVGRLPHQQQQTQHRFEIWKSHWSSPHISTYAQAAFVNAEVSNYLEGALKGKIVFIARGVIPFSEKAKRAQVYKYLQYFNVC